MPTTGSDGLIMPARFVEVSDLTDDEYERWRNLADASLEPNVSFEPDLLIPADRHVLGDHELTLVIVGDGERFNGLLPLRTVDKWQGIPIKVLTSRLDDEVVPVLPILGTPLLRPECAADAMSALLVAAGELARRRRAGFLVLERLNSDGPTAELIGRTCAMHKRPSYSYAHWEKPVFSRRDGQDYRAETLHRERMRDLAKKERRLARITGSPVTVSDRDQDPLAVEDFLRIEASGWKGEGGTAMALDPRLSAFFHDSCSRLSVASRHHLLTLEAGSRPIAMSWCVESGNGLFLLRICHDDNYGKFSPGGQLEVATVEFFHRSTRATIIDPCCAPTNTFHAHFLPDRSPMASSIIAVGGLSSRAFIGLFPFVAALWRRARSARTRLASKAVTLHGKEDAEPNAQDASIEEAV
jgi:CelD/BcsL family acetyltransferase involved in cellulose biosynthesis